jgi:hypothetical protein
VKLPSFLRLRLNIHEETSRIRSPLGFFSNSIQEEDSQQVCIIFLVGSSSVDSSHTVLMIKYWIDWQNRSQQDKRLPINSAAGVSSSYSDPLSCSSWRCSLLVYTASLLTWNDSISFPTFTTALTRDFKCFKLKLTHHQTPWQPEKVSNSCMSSSLHNTLKIIRFLLMHRTGCTFPAPIIQCDISLQSLLKCLGK